MVSQKQFKFFGGFCEELGAVRPDSLLDFAYTQFNFYLNDLVHVLDVTNINNFMKSRSLPTVMEKQPFLSVCIIDSP